MDMGDFNHRLLLLPGDTLCLPHLQQVFTQVNDLSHQISITKHDAKRAS